MSILFMILKIIGIILLIVLGIFLTILILVLFVPIRYRVNGAKDQVTASNQQNKLPVFVKAKVSWLLHILNITYTYPNEAYVRVKILCFTIFSSQNERKEKKRERNKGNKDKSNESHKKNNNNQSKANKVKKESVSKQEKIITKMKETDLQNEEEFLKKDLNDKQFDLETNLENKEISSEHKQQNKNLEYQNTKKRGFFSRLKELYNLIKSFFIKLWKIIHNIRYTIEKLYVKIKNVVSDINYYIEIIQSESFRKAFSLCTSQLKSIYKNIKPSKLKVNITVGTGDPASTGQILGIFSILYPIIGNNVFINPDFENAVFFGDFDIKGSICIYKLLWTAFIIYKDKNLRNVIKKLKREDL